MSTDRNPDTDSNRSLVYEIRLNGRLACRWAEWFGDVRIGLDENGDTRLICPVADQAALHGLLRKVRDLGLPLQSVIRMETDG
jgi:hypothetical protein